MRLILLCVSDLRRHKKNTRDEDKPGGYPEGRDGDGEEGERVGEVGEREMVGEEEGTQYL